MAFALNKFWRDKKARSTRAVQLRHRTMVASLAAVPIYLGFAAVSYFLYDARIMASTSALAAAMTLFALLTLLVSKSESLAGHCFTLALAIQVFGEMSFNGGMEASSVTLSTLIVPAAVFTAGSRAVWPWAFITVSSIAVLFTLDSMALLSRYELPETAQEIDRLLSVAAGVVISAVLIVVYDRQADQAMVKLRRERADFQHHALHDALTGLPNRRQFYEAGERSLQSAELTASERVLFYIDIDRFKEVNDQHGHAIGDELLIEFATRLVNCAGTNVLTARLAGDEFALITETPTDQGWLDQKIDQLRDITQTPFVALDLTLHPGMSVGVACYPIDGSDLDALLKVADSRMYQEKSSATEVFSLPPGGSVIPLPKKAG